MASTSSASASPEPAPLACALMGNEPSDNGTVLGLVFEQMAKHRRLTVLDRDWSPSYSGGPPSFAAVDLLSCALACKRWSLLCEEFLFRHICKSFGWRPPRMPRRASIKKPPSILEGQWTQLYLSRSCSFCHE